MKYKVLEKFTDKYTKAAIPAGIVIDLEEKRAKEILSVGEFIEKVEENPSENAPEEQQGDVPAETPENSLKEPVKKTNARKTTK